MKGQDKAQEQEQPAPAGDALAKLKAAIADHHYKLVAFNNSSGKISAVDQTALTELVRSAADLKAQVNDIDELPTPTPAPGGPAARPAPSVFERPANS
jgi:hypothetical protein